MVLDCVEVVKFWWGSAVLFGHRDDVGNKKHGFKQEKHLFKTVCLFTTLSAVRAAVFIAGLCRFAQR